MENRRNFLGKLGGVLGMLLLLFKIDWGYFSRVTEEPKTDAKMNQDSSYGQYLSEVLEAHRFSKNSKQIKKLNQRFEEITKALQEHYRGDIHAPFKTGSIAKGTAIRTNYDLDMLVPFKYEKFKGDYKEMFNDLFKTLQRAGFKPRKQNVSIGVPIKLSSNETRTNYIDVVPGHEVNPNNYLSSGGDLILHVDRKADLMGEYVKTNIKRQFKYIKQNNPLAIDIIRLLKIWKVTNEVYFKSFIIELVTIQALKVPPQEKGLYVHLKHVMRYMADRLEREVLYDPGNRKNDIMKALEPARKKQIAGRLGNMLKKLEQEEKEGKKQAIKKYFPK